MKIISTCYTLILSLLLINTYSIQAIDLQDHNLYVNQIKVEDLDFLQNEEEFINLSSSISDKNNDKVEFFHIFERTNGDAVVLQDGAQWDIGWWYTGEIKKWKKGNRLKISYHSEYNNHFCIENVDTSSKAWGTLKNFPSKENQDTISRRPNGKGDADAGRKIVLKSGYVFYLNSETPLFLNWNLNERIFILHAKEGSNYDLWNFDQQEIVFNCTLAGIDKQKGNGAALPIENVLDLEERLNKRVLAQPIATNAVTAAILNYCSGLKNPQTPIAVFLFLGPTGVGKTELAKVLAEELYQNKTSLIRFDMSHFTTQYSITRLIGSDPGYVNHEEGGQLTEAIKNKPQSIVLLDEIEKAHPAIRKVFLPVFDEGYITDAKDQKLECNNIVFVMTSNLCAKEILEFLAMGLDPQDVLSAIEPTIMSELSPELYNRCEPIIFAPLQRETMDDLVNLMLKDIQKRLKEQKQYTIIIDQTAKDYLITNGYHPQLGARPLKKLIEKKVIASISFAVIKDQIPAGSTITVNYYSDDNTWHVDWF